MPHSWRHSNIPCSNSVPIAPCRVNSRGGNGLQWTRQMEASLCISFYWQKEECGTGPSIVLSLVHLSTDVSPAVHAETSSALSATCGCRVWQWMCFSFQRHEILPSVNSKSIFISEFNLQSHKSQHQAPRKSSKLGVSRTCYFSFPFNHCWAAVL